MFEYLQGRIAQRNSAQITLDVAGVGYRISISLQTYAALEGQDQALLYIHYHVNGQDYRPSLYGFASTSERDLFELLIGVQGVGSTTALVILSSLRPAELGAAILQDRQDIFKSIKGIGEKTAKRIILDLKDKIQRVLGDSDSQEAVNLGPQTADNPAREAALQALLALGFTKIPAQRALNRVVREKPELKNEGELLRAALNELRS